MLIRKKGHIAATEKKKGGGGGGPNKNGNKNTKNLETY